MSKRGRAVRGLSVKRAIWACDREAAEAVRGQVLNDAATLIWEPAYANVIDNAREHAYDALTALKNVQK